MAEDFDRIEHNKQVGAIGGRSRSPEKLQAVRFNAAKARAAKEFYRRNPELRPQRNQPEGATND